MLPNPIKLPVLLSDSLPGAKEDYHFAECHVHSDIMHVVFFIQFAIPENDPHRLTSGNIETTHLIHTYVHNMNTRD